MVRPDPELLSLEVGAEKKTGPDHGQAFSVGRGVVLLGWDEAPAVVADWEDALVRLLLQEGTADLDGAGIGIQDERPSRRGSARVGVDVKRSLRYSKAANWAASSGGSTCGNVLLVSLVRGLAMCA